MECKTMRILVLIHRPLRSLSTGAARVIHDTYTGLSKLSHDILIVSLSRKGDESNININELQYIDLREDILSRMFLLPFRMLTAASREGLSFLQLSIMPKIYEKSPKILNKVTKIVKKFNPDIVISELIYMGFLANRISMETCSDFIIRSHNMEAEYLSILAPNSMHILLNHLIYPLEQKILLLPSRVITLSYRDAFLFNKIYKLDAKFLGIPLRKLPEEFACERDVEKLNLKPYNYFLFTGSLHKPNILVLREVIRAAKYLESKSTITIAIAGSISKALPKSRPSNIKVLGIVPMKVLHSLYTYAEASIAPIFQGSGVAIKLVESLIYGLPTITTRKALLMLPGLKHGENIYITRNIDSFVKDVQTLVEDTQLRETIKRGAQNFSKKHLNYQKILRRYELMLTAKL